MFFCPNVTKDHYGLENHGGMMFVITAASQVLENFLMLSDMENN